MPELDSQQVGQGPTPANAATLEEWLALQPHLDEVAKFILINADMPMPDWFLAAIPRPELRRTREELIEIAAAAIASIRIMDREAAGG